MNISKFDPSLTLEKLLYTTENQYFDRKSARLSPNHLATHFSAFANADGGLLVIGIEDDGTITGVSEDQENDFRKVPFNFLQIPPQYEAETISCTLKSGSPGNILLFHIHQSVNEIIKLKTGDAYLRLGDSSSKLNVERLTALEYSKGIKTFETRIVEDATIDDLDFDLIKKYTELLNPTVSSPLDILKSRGLIKGKENQYQITVAAILLFGKFPTQFLPGSRIRFLRYEGTEAQVGTNINIVKDITLEKPIPELLKEAKLLIESQMREFQQLDRDGVFRKIPEYPAFAWLEGLVNAITHRDYSIQGDYIRVIMFDDRIEFSSPGRLPSIVTVDNIQTTRFSRNPMIARVLSDFGWVRELNEGVKRIYTDMQTYFLDPPVFSEPNGNTVLLVLRNNIVARSMRKITAQMTLFSKQWKDLNEFDQLLVLCIANLEKCTTKRLVDFTGKSRPTILAHIKALLDKGMIVEHSSSLRDPTKYYTIK